MNLMEFICKRKSQWFLWYLRRTGITIGEGCYVYSPRHTVFDLTRPYLITLGNNVQLARGAIILTHGFEWSPLREKYKRPFGNCAAVNIGDNVFIGMNAIILKGVEIGANSVVGAGAVVTRSVPENSVVAGNPAKVVCGLEKLHEKFIDREREEAFMQVKSLIDSGRTPVESDFYKSYFYLFWDRTKPCPEIIKAQVGKYYDEFLISKPIYKNFNAFIDDAKKAIKRLADTV